MAIAGQGRRKVPPEHGQSRGQGRFARRFAQTGGRLQVRGGGPLQGFAVAGADGKFFAAQARLLGRREVLAWSPAVPQAVAVRYGWVDNPQDANLMGGTGLPASPLRSDDWPLVTQGVGFVP
jgi:sialate O-acetylesterase